MIGRNDPCWCGSRKKWKKCHFPEEGGGASRLAKQYYNQYRILLKTDEQIAGIKRACTLTAHVLKETCAQAKKGVTTNALNDFAHKMILEAGATPAPLHYGSPPFPKSICTSKNDEICHGIPDDIPLEEGDIMNIDISCKLDGYYGDCSAMVMIGQVSEERAHVVAVAKECLERAIRILKPGLMLCDIGKTIEAYATEQKCSVVNMFVGHGVGLEFHEAPQVAHHANTTQIPLAPGMTFTIEPMINAGVREGVIDPSNHWTARTTDGRASGQWEHTLLITDSGHEILTLPMP